jgi:hypothetical protein
MRIEIDLVSDEISEEPESDLASESSDERLLPVPQVERELEEVPRRE